MMKEKLIFTEIIMTVLIRGNDIGAHSVRIDHGQVQKAELLEVMESRAEHEIEDYAYTDMDQDGVKELIGVYLDEDNYCHAWYCSGDGQTCMLVYQGNTYTDRCIVEILDIGDEIHIALNNTVLFGPWKHYSILALQNQEIVCLLSDQHGYVRLSDERDVVLTVEAYDGCYEPDFGMTTHTWKHTYLYYDGGMYKEYVAAEMTEEEFLTYRNAQTVKDKIDAQWKQSDITALEYTYYIRQNGIMHIQCDVQDESGGMQYGYYTVRYEGGILEREPGEYNPGQMDVRFSDLEAVYAGNRRVSG